MAHVTKFKAFAVSPMVGHYNREAERRGYERDNIDGSRTPENYAIGSDTTDGLADAVRARVAEAIEEHERTAGKAVRKDANVLCDWVVTLPEDCPKARAGDFFAAVVGFIRERYGAENVPGGFVHVDESTPHAHVPVVPVRDGRLVASKVIDRADLKSFHGELGRAVDEALGMHVSIELDEQQKGEKQLSALDQVEYMAAKERLEGLRREEARASEEVEEFQPAAETLGESVRALWTARNDGEREEGLRSEIEGLRSRISAAESECERLRGRVGELERGLPGLRERARRLEGSVRAARARVERLAEKLHGYLEGVGRRAAALLQFFGVEAYAGNAPLDAQVRSFRQLSQGRAPLESHQDRGFGGIDR